MTTAETRLTSAGRVAAAARAAWWCFLIAAAVVVVQFLVYSWAVRNEAVWTWATCLMATDSQTARLIMLIFMAGMRIVLVTWLLGSIFLSLWARRLRRVEQAA